jgi:hypothetical protein
MTDDGLEKTVERFLDSLTWDEVRGLMPLSDRALDCLPRMAGYVWAADHKHLSTVFAEQCRVARVATPRRPSAGSAGSGQGLG